MDQQVIPIRQVVNLSQYEAHITRKVVKKDFHCHLLLLQNNKLDIIAKINNKILPARQKQKTMKVQQEYIMGTIPRNTLYPTAPLL